MATGAKRAKAIPASHILSPFDSQYKDPETLETLSKAICGMLRIIGRLRKRIEQLEHRTRPRRSKSVLEEI